MDELRQNLETELRQSLENKNRTISRLLKEKSNLETELCDIKQKLSKLKRNLKSKQSVRLQISIIQNEDNEGQEIINIE